MSLPSAGIPAKQRPVPKKDNERSNGVICVSVKNENMKPLMDAAFAKYIPIQEYLSAVVNAWVEANLREDS